MTLVRHTTAHVGAAAPGCPAERSCAGFRSGHSTRSGKNPTGQTPARPDEGVWAFAIYVALASALLLSACSKETKEEPTVAVQAVAAEKTTLHQTITAQAILFPLQQAAITPKISAPVRKFYVNRGSRVHQDQLLAVLENRDLAASSEENKGGLAQAQATYETTTAASLPEEMQKAQFDAEAAKKMLEAQEKVFHSREELFQQGALPRKELEQAGVDVTQARNQYQIAQKHFDALQAIGKQQELKSAAGQLQAAKGKSMGAEAQLSYSEIRSPIDGFVTDRPLYPGEMAAAGAPLITVMDISHVIAKAHIPQPDAALLKLGDHATLTAPGEDDPVEGKVTVISPALDPNSTTVEVWVQAANPKQRLKPGTSVQVSMLAQTVKDAVAVPAASVLTAQDGITTVMIVGTDSHAHQTTVKTGIHDGDRVQMADGVHAGDRVITSGAYGLPDNTKVSVEAPADSGEKQSGDAADQKDDKKDKK
ncbi:MAG TPA: efflux RND transporter periplasmic adaptor subunit [Terriglobales bacterium]|jgi:HlyD family secretion protein|nr:efflux RND transporter periplasmic adaptor subunit [Terriglobales bacterium]